MVDSDFHQSQPLPLPSTSFYCKFNSNTCLHPVKSLKCQICINHFCATPDELGWLLVLKSLHAPPICHRIITGDIWDIVIRPAEVEEFVPHHLDYFLC